MLLEENSHLCRVGPPLEDGPARGQSRYSLLLKNTEQHYNIHQQSCDTNALSTQAIELTKEELALADPAGVVNLADVLIGK